MEKEKHYGLATAITMIVGICIGSGIFFKADDILRFTGGSVRLGVLVLAIGAFSIIFGSISLTELSVRTSKNGGLVGFFEDFISPSLASAFGWFQTFLYYPTINVVVCWAAGIYTTSLFTTDSSLELQVLVGTGYLLFFYLLNYFSLKLGGRFQILSTYIKLLPLVGIAIAGLFWHKQPPAIPTGTPVMPLSPVGWGWLAALAPVAFSYDGWPIATSITNEIDQPKKNMPLALLIGPLIVLAVYISYFLGLNKILGPSYILSTGNQAIYAVGEQMVGPLGGPLITVFVIISILGVSNGVTLGNLRMPQALATKHMLPNAKKIAQIDPKHQLSPYSFWICLGCSLVWMFIHYLTQKTGILAGGDISEIAIVFGYICYPILYFKIIQLYRRNEITSFFKGILAPFCAILGSLIITIGGLLSNLHYVPIFLLICLVFCLAGYLFYQKNGRKN